MKSNLVVNIFKFMVTAVTMCISIQTYSQGTIDIRDPIRGVTFHSIEISSDPMSELQFRENQFSDSDQLKIGISALFFDDSTEVDEYILWFHHNGASKWFISSQLNPLTIQYGDKDSALDLLHISSINQANETGFFTEKLEFVVDTKKIFSLLEANSVRFQLTTAFGDVVKVLTEEEMELLRMFDARIRMQHSKFVSMRK